MKRRDFLKTTALGAGATLLGSRHALFASDAVLAGSVILFQGDSVTDNYRNTTIALPNDQRALGAGYPYLVTAAELHAHPAAGLSFFNRGVSGNKIPDLEARWQKDTLDIKPDVLSVLVGVNDYWHTMLNGYAGTLADYETRYLALLQRTKAALPNVRFVVMEPVALQKTNAQISHWFPDARWTSGFPPYQAAAKRVAQATGAIFVALQHAFDKAAAKSNAESWLYDGVHPTPAGHELIAEAWRSAAGKLIR